MIAIPLYLGAPLVEVIGAAALLLIAFALTTILVKPIAFLLGNIPVIGGNIARALYAGATDLTDWALSWAKSAVGAFVQLLAAPVTWLSEVFGEVASFAEATGAAIARTATTLGVWASWAVAQVGALAARLATLAYDTGQSLLALTARIPAVASALITAALVPVTQALAAIRAGLAALAASEAAALAAARGSLLQLIGAQGAALTAAIAATAATIRGEVAADVTAIDGELAQLRGVVAPIVAASLVTVVPAIVSEIDTLRRTCIEPTCSVVQPQLGTLTALLDGTVLFALGALIGEAVANPATAAADTAAVVGGIETGAADLVALFAGVQL